MRCLQQAFCRMDHWIAHNKTETHCRNLVKKFEVVKFEPKAITAPDINVNDKRLSNYLFSYIRDFLRFNLCLFDSLFRKFI